MRQAHRILPFVTQCSAAFLQPPCSLQHTSQQLFAPVSAAVNTALARHSPGWHSCASIASFASDATVTLDGSQSTLDSINDRFSEAREEIDLAKDDAETTYFNESHAEAKKAVDSALDLYNHLLEQLSPADAAKLQRSMGLKMEQLKAELKQLDTLHD